MARLTDPDRLFAYKDALSNWNCEGYIKFRIPQSSHDWIQRSLSGMAYKEIGRLMNEFVSAGGEIDEQPETRTGWCDDFEFHHDLRFPIEGVATYVETCLIYRLPVIRNCSSILVVNIHAV